MKSHIALLIIFIIFCSAEIISQVQQEWVRIFDGQLQYWDDPSGIVTDDSGNVYIGGTSAGNGGDFSSTFEYVTFKYSPLGQLMWLSRYNGDPFYEDVLLDIQKDNSSNIYVTGLSYISQLQTFRWATLKYNRDGQQQWLKIYGIDSVTYWYSPMKMKIDEYSNIYLTGHVYSNSTKRDIALVKYNSEGQLLWSKMYNRIDSTNEKMCDMILSNNNYVYILGSTEVNGTSQWWKQDVVILKYDSEGSLIWSRIFVPPLDTIEVPSSLLADGSDNIYVSGYHHRTNQTSDMFVIKYNSAGQLLWYKTFAGPHGYIINVGSENEMPVKLHLDSLGNLFALSTVYNSTQGYNDVSFRKLNPNGYLLYSSTYSSPENGNDYLRNSIKDEFDNVYIVGSTYEGSSNGNMNLLVLKFNSIGELLWNQVYSGPGCPYNCDDYGMFITGDNFNNIIVTGITENGHFSTDILTIKYSQAIGIKPISNEIPETFSLHQNYPNPFNPATKIRFQAPLAPPEEGTQNVELAVYDLLGRKISTLFSSPWGRTGGAVYEVDFDGINFASGVYFYMLKAGNYTITKKMVLMK